MKKKKKKESIWQRFKRKNPNWNKTAGQVAASGSDKKDKKKSIYFRKKRSK